MKLRLAAIHDSAAQRPPGYVADVLSRGRITGDWLEISAEQLAALRAKYRPATPALGTMAASAARAVLAETGARFHGAPAVPEETIASRMEICRSCIEFIPEQERCALCGCYSALKIRLRSQACPQGQW